MNYQDPIKATNKSSGTPLYSSAWLALFEEIRASFKQNPTT